MDKEEVVTIAIEVLERQSSEAIRPIRWAVVAAFAAGANGDPVCVEYRVRQVRGASTQERLVNLHRTLDAMQDQASNDWIGDGDFLSVGIPRYVFEQASQGRMLDRARASLARAGKGTSKLSPESRALLSPPAHKPGRPPSRSLYDKLLILEAVQSATSEGRTLEEVAKDFHMSRSAVRDLLSWARRDATPRLFTARGHGRGGGELTTEARSLLRELRSGEGKD